jgi:hypothetical protein
MAVRHLLGSRIALAVVTALIGALVAGSMTFAFASHTDPNEIHACVDKQGNPRIVDDPANCKASETPLTWNAQGQQGPPGVSGYEVVTVTSTTSTDVTVSCPTGKKVFGGGGVLQPAEMLHDMAASFPVGETAWRTIIEPFSSPLPPGASMDAYAVCASVA